MKFFEGLRERNVSVRILTNSLASTDMSVVHSGYQAFRAPLLGMGVDLYEVRPVLGQPVVRGNQLKSPSSGRYALHAKVVRVRSPASVRRFDEPRPAVVAPQYGNRTDHREPGAGAPDCAALRGHRATGQQLRSDVERGRRIRINATSSGAHWKTETRWTSTEEPDVTFWQRLQVDMLSLLPLDELL